MPAKERKTKITVDVPSELLRSAQRSYGRGISETVRQGLRLVAAASAYKELRALRGKVKLELDLPRLREDRA